MTNFSKKSLVLLILIALVLFVGMTALIYSFFPNIDWDAPPPEASPSPQAAFVYLAIDKNV